MRLPLLCLLATILLAPLRAAEPTQPQGERIKAKGEDAPAGEKPLSPLALRPSPFFRPGDVIALVGGEDMVAASEYGYLELLLVRALPDYRLRFRNLAWEGDTVVEQRRDLNFPTWEEQLDKIGATVVIAQFGQMECLAGVQSAARPLRFTAEDAKSAEGRRGKAEAKENPSADLSISSAPSAVKSAPDGLPEFIAAYGTLLHRLGGKGKRRLLVLPPTGFAQNSSGLQSDQKAEQLARERFAGANERYYSYLPAIAEMMSQDLNSQSLRRLPGEQGQMAFFIWMTPSHGTFQNDSLHLNRMGHLHFAAFTAQSIDSGTDIEVFDHLPALEPLRQLIRAKNRLWFDYWRPQNWAFLAGDRTAQPSSRDHLDLTKRWFPPEREAFLPLIEAKEKEIDALAAQLATGK